MISTNLPIERGAAINSIPRPKPPRALALLFIIHPVLLGFGAFLKEQPVKAAYRKYPYTPPKSPGSTATATSPCHSPPQQNEHIYIDALARAALYYRYLRPHANLYLTSCTRYTYHKARRRNVAIQASQTRLMHHATNVRPAIVRTMPSREEYLNLIDTYKELYSTQAQWMEPTAPPPFPALLTSTKSTPFSVDSSMPPSRPLNLKPSILTPEPLDLRPPSLMDDAALIPLAPVTVPDFFDVKSPTREGTTFSDTPSEVREASPILHSDSPRPGVMHLLHVLDNPECTHSEAYNAYSAVPSPGVSHLSEPGRRLLFRRLSAHRKKDRDSALRYLSVVDDMKSLDFPMTEQEWNSAIAYCGQCFSHVRPAEVENALLTWKEMERDANIKSGNVTFNILFDMAAKAGKFVLADMILKEMAARGLEYNRYFRVGNIYFHGLKGDGDGVRQAYRELVEAGEIVDTVVMNCVIASLISAGELASAENVYDRMKRMLSEHTGVCLQTLTWQDRRNLGRIFDRLARNNRSSKRKSEHAQLNHLKHQISIVPDVHTYAIFIEHHVSHTGDLYRISALLREMQSLGITTQGRIFLKLFKGFAKHGGNDYTLWTPSRLQSVWNSLLEILDHGHEDVTLKKWMIVWAVKAFAQCAGKEWASHIWEELTSRWEGGVEEVRSARARLQYELSG